MKIVLINAVFLILALHVEPARVMALVKGSVCPSHPLLPDSSTDRSYRVSAIRRMILEGKQDEAMQLAEDLIGAEGTNYEGYFWKGYIQHQRREFYSAIKTLRTAERSNPQGNAIAKLLSICYDLLGQRQLSLRKMQEAATLDPRDFAPHYYLGRNAAGSFKC